MVEISAGTCAAPDSRGRPGDTYEKGARVPKDDWRSLAASSFAELTASSGVPFNRNSIAVIPLPTALRRSIEQVNVVEQSKSWTAPEAEAARNELTRLSMPFVRSHMRDDPLVDELGLVVNAANQRTVTVNGRSGQRTGLHLDSWDGLSLVERDRATNRIGINLSHEHRWLLFCDIAVTTIVDRLANCPTKGSLLPDAFFTAYPDQPVIRVRIDPGHAYLGPTENMLHDGSTAGTTEPGAILFFRGYFTV